MIKLFKVKPATKQSGTSGLTLSQFLLQQKPRAQLFKGRLALTQG